MICRTPIGASELQAIDETVFAAYRQLELFTDDDGGRRQTSRCCFETVHCKQGRS